MVAMDDWTVEELEALVRRAAPFAELPRSALESVLDMLSGRYPSDEFAELRPRLNWDRVEGRLVGRPGAQRLAVTSGGTIPDRGLFGVYLVGERQTRVGELDEEMVYESRVGEVFTLGASSWRIEDITHDRVLVTRAAGRAGPRPRRVPPRAERPGPGGAAAAASGGRAGRQRRRQPGRLPGRAARGDRGAARRPHHRGRALPGRAGRLAGLHPLAVRRPGPRPMGPGHRGPGPGAARPRGPDHVHRRRRGGAATGGRRGPARRLDPVRPRRDRGPGRRRGRRLGAVRQPLPRVRGPRPAAAAAPAGPPHAAVAAATAQRRPAPGRLQVRLVPGRARDHARMPPGRLRPARPQGADGRGRQPPGPGGRGRHAVPVAVRQLAAVRLRRRVHVRGRRARGPDGLHDALRLLGDLTVQEAAARSADPDAAPGWLAELEATRRAVRLRVGGHERWVAIEDVARLRDGLGAAPPVGVPQAFLEPVADPVGDLLARYARTHGPFLAGDPAGRLGLGVAVVEQTLARLAAAGRVVHGEFRPGGSGREWLDAEVLRRLRRRSLAALRKEVEPVPQQALARFLAAWQGVGPSGPRATDLDALFRVVEQLQGAAVPASALERQVLAARLPGYHPGLLDQLCASGEVVWAGAGAIGSDDGWVGLYLAEGLPLLLPEPLPVELTPLAAAVREALAGRGAMFFRQLADAVGGARFTGAPPWGSPDPSGPSGAPPWGSPAPSGDSELLLAVWELVWAGMVTNDTLVPLRALVAGGSRPAARPQSRRRYGRRGPPLPSRAGPPAGAGRWSLLPAAAADPTRRLHAVAEQLLDRHGVLTRGAVMAERLPGGFAGVYPVLKAMEDAGRCRRGYFVDGLGGAQFAVPGAVDRLR